MTRHNKSQCRPELILSHGDCDVASCDDDDDDDSDFEIIIGDSSLWYVWYLAL